MNSKLNKNTRFNTLPISPYGLYGKKKIHDCLIIWTCNVECLSANKLGDLTYRMIQEKPHIVAIQETWLKPDSHSDTNIKISGYNIIRKDRTSAPHGGILTYIREDISAFECEDDISSKNHESQWIRIPTARNTLYFSNNYRPPSDDSKIFDSLLYDVEHFQSKNDRPIILLSGDFNCHHSTWLGSRDCNGNPKNNEAGIACKNFCDLSGLKNYVKENTFNRIGNMTRSILDLILTDVDDSIISIKINDAISTSPHSMISVKINFKIKKEKTFQRTHWQYHRTNWEDMNKRLSECNWIFSEDINEAWNLVKNNILNTMTEFIPNKIVKKNVNNQPWFTDCCASACDNKIKAWKKYKKNNTDELFKIYNEAKKVAERTYEDAKINYKMKIETNLNEGKNNPKIWWKIVKQVAGQNGKVNIPTLLHDDIYYESAKEKAELLKNVFASKSQINDFNRQAPLIPNKSTKSLNNIKIRVRAVKKKLECLNINKATGPDGISPRILKECSATLARPLASLFQLSLKKGLVPVDWKIANVVPVYKGEKKSDPSNYRPISLLSSISKIMEQVINDALKRHLLNFHLLSSNQYGFQKGKSTIDLLLGTTQRWTDALDKGQEIKAISLDISRAFDRVWHKGLLTKLMSLGIGGTLYRWIRDFLTNRSLKVVLNGQSSSVAHINAGVPQGSILGPTLFLIFINDLEENIKSNISMFADDTSIYTIIPDKTSRKSKIELLQNDLCEIENWAEKWLVNFNVKKTKQLTLSRKKDIESTSLIFYSEKLKDEPNIKLLGLNLSHHLDWNIQIDKMAKNAGRRLGILRKAKKFLPSYALEVMYKSQVRSTMEYCSPLWNGASQIHLNKLDNIQKKAIKIIGNNNLQIDSLQHRREVGGLCIMYKMYTGLASTNLSNLLGCSQAYTRITRQASNAYDHALTIQKSRTSHHQSSFIPSFTKKWNTIPPSTFDTNIITRNNNMLQCFKLNVHKYLKGVTPR